MHVEDARALHDELPVMDLHADTPKLMSRLGYDLMARHRPPASRINYAGHVDVPRMREGGLGAQIFGMWTFPYPERGCARDTHRQLSTLADVVARHPDTLALAPTAEAIRAAHAAGKIAVLAGIEGGQALESKRANVEVFARRGVRYIGLLHFSANALGCPARGSGEDAGQGLTGFGRDVIREMNRLGVVVDLAHINRKGFFDALSVTTAPVMVTHTGVVGVHEHWRNIDDEQLRAVAENGGCVGIIFAPRFLGAGGIDAVCDHILHILKVVGADVPALGSDFDGFVIPPRGLEDVAALPRLTAALAARGVDQTTLKKILGENALRVLADVPPRALTASSRVA
jgi:membrane dipeptidase